MTSAADTRDGTPDDAIRGYLPAPEGTHPPLDSPAYRSTALRAPHRPPVVLPPSLTEIMARSPRRKR